MSEYVNPSLGPAPRSFLFSLFVNYKFFKKLSESIKNVWQNSRLRVTRTFFCHLAPFYHYFVSFLFIFFSMHFTESQGDFQCSYTPYMYTLLWNAFHAVSLYQNFSFFEQRKIHPFMDSVMHVTESLKILLVLI